MGRWQTIREPEHRWAYWGQQACVLGEQEKYLYQAESLLGFNYWSAFIFTNDVYYIYFLWF